MYKRLHNFLMAALGLFSATVCVADASEDRTYQVGVTHIEYVDAAHDQRPMVMELFYPAFLQDATSAKPVTFPFYTGFSAYRDAQIAVDGKPYPLRPYSPSRSKFRPAATPHLLRLAPRE